MRPSRRVLVLAAASTLLVTACDSDDGDEAEVGDIEVSIVEPATTGSEASESSDQEFPDIINASAMLTNGAWTFQVTVSSPYDSPERYADGWRILGPDGSEYGFRLLTHDHASEQPFTRSLSDVQIPAGVDVVTIEGRDQLNGFGGNTFELSMSGG